MGVRGLRRAKTEWTLPRALPWATLKLPRWGILWAFAVKATVPSAGSRSEASASGVPQAAARVVQSTRRCYGTPTVLVRPLAEASLQLPRKRVTQAPPAVGESVECRCAGNVVFGFANHSRPADAHQRRLGRRRYGGRINAALEGDATGGASTPPWKATLGEPPLPVPERLNGDVGAFMQVCQCLKTVRTFDDGHVWLRVGRLSVSG